MSLPIVIVGGGVFGLCSALELSRRGADCLLLEAGELLSGATGHSGGMIRIWHGDPSMREWAAEGQKFWQQRTGYHRTGSLYFELPGQKPELYPGTRWLNAHEGRERFPQFSWADDDGAIYEPEAGWVDTHAACGEVAREAQSLGTEIRTGVRVEKLEPGVVHTTQGAIRAGAVVWAAGCHSADPLDCNPPASENRFIQVMELAPNFPDLPCFLDRRTLGFGRAIHGGSLWIGVGLKTLAQDHRTVDFDPEDADRARQVAQARLPLVADREFLSGVRTPDRYLSERRPLFGKSDRDGLYFAWCGSGGGFKVAPTLARKLAEEMMLCPSP